MERAGRSDVERGALAALSKNLRALLRDKRISQSQLAYLVWGQDANGHAKGRDKIGTYVRGISLPLEATLRKIAEALDVTPDDLGMSLELARSTPPQTAVARVQVPRLGLRAFGVADNPVPPISFVPVDGQPGRLWLIVRANLSAADAMKYAELIGKDMES